MKLLATDDVFVRGQPEPVKAGETVEVMQKDLAQAFASGRLVDPEAYAEALENQAKAAEESAKKAAEDAEALAKSAEAEAELAKAEADRVKKESAQVAKAAKTPPPKPHEQK
jgi:hypothetical protein